MYKYDLELNNLQWLICHKNQPTNQIRPQLHYIKSEMCYIIKSRFYCILNPQIQLSNMRLCEKT